MKNIQKYGAWLAKRGMAFCTMEEAREMACEYILHFSSTFSQKTVRSALARVFDCRGKDLCELRTRRAADIRRGRMMTKGMSEIENAHPEAVEVCRSVGPRHDRELWQLCPDNFFHDSKGNLRCHIVGKGGRKRDVLVIGNGRGIIERDLASGKWKGSASMYYLPLQANVHRYRADYASRAYEYAAAHGNCTGKKYKGYDCGALDFVDLQLGHGKGRYYTVTVNYLSYGRSDNGETDGLEQLSE